MVTQGLDRFHRGAAFHHLWCGPLPSRLHGVERDVKTESLKLQGLSYWQSLFIPIQSCCVSKLICIVSRSLKSPCVSFDKGRAQGPLILHTCQAFHKDHDNERDQDQGAAQILGCITLSQSRLLDSNLGMKHMKSQEVQGCDMHVECVH